MKTIFYTPAFFKKLIVAFSAALLFGSITNAQTFRIFNTGSEFPSGGAAGGQANLNDVNGSGIQTGLKIRVTQGGTVSAIHFYQGTGHVGSHTVNLWNINGTNLATATLPADATTGWRTVAITPTVIVPGTTYVISVFNANGDYAASGSGIPPSDFSGRAPFIIIAGTAPSVADPANPGNGVFTYSNVSNAGIPATETGGLFNYWVDLTFTTFFPLPVTLTDFSASSDNHDITLTWKTEFEQNNKGFQVERSNNNSDWYPVTFINGIGQSSVTRNYSYVDKGLAPGHYYYRLKQVDFDGVSKSSTTVTAAITGKGTVSLFQNVPNPFSGTTKIRFDLPSAQKVRLSIFDLNGREIKVLIDNTQEAGSHLTTIDAAGLSRQLYYVRLQTEGGTLVRKIVIE